MNAHEMFTFFITFRRKSDLRTGLNSHLRNKIKLTRRELKVTVTQTARLMEDFYPDHVMKRLPKTEADFWEDKHLDVDDWQGTKSFSDADM